MTFQHQQVHAGSVCWSWRIQFAVVYLSQLYKVTSKKPLLVVVSKQRLVLALYQLGLSVPTVPGDVSGLKEIPSPCSLSSSSARFGRQDRGLPGCPWAGGSLLPACLCRAERRCSSPGASGAGGCTRSFAGTAGHRHGSGRDSSATVAGDFCVRPGGSAGVSEGREKVCARWAAAEPRRGHRPGLWGAGAAGPRPVRCRCQG